jgi:hypothetical protein
MDREQIGDRIGAKGPPNSEKPKAANRTRAAGSNAPPARSAWLKQVCSYDRRERREYQVIRFG